MLHGTKSIEANIGQVGLHVLCSSVTSIPLLDYGGVEQTLAARQAHNLEVAGSTPAPAIAIITPDRLLPLLLEVYDYLQSVRLFLGGEEC